MVVFKDIYRKESELRNLESLNVKKSYYIILFNFLNYNFKWIHLDIIYYNINKKSIFV